MKTSSTHDKKARKAKFRPDKPKMNAGGYYEGMPGCVTNVHGHRKMLDFVVTEEGKSTSLIYAHPQLVKTAVQQAMSNHMVKGVLYGAVVDDMFSKKNPLNWPLRARYWLMRYFSYLKGKRQANKNLKDAIKHQETKEIRQGTA